MTQIGVNISERDAQGVGTLQPASVYNGGVIVRAPKGPLGKAFLVNSLETFESVFGRVNSTYNSWYMMKGLFQNIATQRPNIWVVREFDPAQVGVSAISTIGAGMDTLVIEAGYLGDDSPGTHGNSIHYRIIAGDTSGKYVFEVFENIGGTLLLVESTPEWDLTDVEQVVNTFSKWIKVTLTGTPTISVTTPVAQVDTIDTGTISMGTADVTIQTGNMASGIAISVPFNTDADTTASDLADAINAADLGVTAAYSAGNSFTVTSDIAGVPVTYTNESSDVTVTATTPNTPSTVALTTGANPGTPTTSEAISNLDPLLSKDIQRVFSTERTGFGWANQLEAWCSATRGDVLGIIATDSTETPSGGFTGYAPLLTAHSFLAGYFNWGFVDKVETEGEKMIPLIGHVYGAYYVRKKQNNGGYAHIAPGGVTVSLRGVNRLQFLDDLTPGTVTSITRQNGFNVINFVPRFGFVTESSRTFSTTSKFYSIHIRESKNFLIQSWKSQLKVFQQRPNNDRTRISLTGTLSLFLGRRYEEGMFETEGGFDNNVRVQCDEFNNDVNVRKNRQLVADVTLNFVEISEEVNLQLIQADGNLQVTEV